MNDADTSEIVTYIIVTESREFYCGKTQHFDKRINQHYDIDKNSWFNSYKRCNFKVIVKIQGDYEKQIKRAGVKVIANILTNVMEVSAS